MAAPVLQAHAGRRGALTRAAAGKVPVAQFMVPDEEDTTGWTWAWTQTSPGGTDHWTTTTDGQCPAPTAAGVTAGLNAGPYVWSVTATNASAETSAPADWTFSIGADVYTVATPTDFTNSGTQGLKAIKALLGGKTVELARGCFDAFDGSGGAEYDDTAKTASVLGFNTHTGRIVFTSEDPANRSKIGRWHSLGAARIDVHGFDVEAYVESRATTGEGDPSDSNAQNIVMFTLGGNSTHGIPIDCTVTDLVISAPAGVDPTQRLKGMTIHGRVPNINTGVTYLQARNITVSGIRMFRLNDAFTQQYTADCLFEDIHVDTYSGEAFFAVGINTNNIEQDNIAVRPFQNPGRAIDHQDTHQSGSPSTVGDSNGNILRRCVFAVADGDAMPQGPYWRNYSYAHNNTTVENVLSDPATYNNIRPDVGTGWNIRRNTAIQGQSAGIAADDIGRGFQRFSNLTPASGTVADNIFNHYLNDSLSDFPDLLTGNLIVSVANPPMPTGINWAEAARIAFYANVFEDAGMVIDYPNLSAAQIADKMRIAYAAKVDGLARKGDGSFYGALFPLTAPDTPAAWNDGTIFEATPPTSISSSAPAATVEVGAPLVVTYQLDAQANQSVSIDPAVSGVTGSFSPDPASISVGQGQVTSTFIATSAGTATITATNNRSLVNPDPLVITVTAAISPPTTYTQSSASVSALGQAVQIVYTLDEPAPGPITITAASTLAGSFPSGETVVIPASGTSGVITFVPSVAGTATLTATNDSGLANPDSIQVVVSSVNVAQLIALGLR